MTGQKENLCRFPPGPKLKRFRSIPKKPRLSRFLRRAPPDQPSFLKGGAGVHLQGFNILRQFEARGGEADIFLVKTGDDEGILKLYRFGINPKMEIVQAMLALSREHPKQFVQIQFFGYHPETRRFFELQEYIREGSLVEYLARTPEGVEETIILAFLRQTCEILSILHANNILHLDLKPGNILLRHADPLEIVLTDFGIASILQKDFSKKMTEVKGTSLFQSPESIAGVVGRPSDWWSLGMIILEMLTGKNRNFSITRG